jgi:hypothetical protein
MNDLLSIGGLLVGPSSNLAGRLIGSTMGRRQEELAPSKTTTRRRDAYRVGAGAVGDVGVPAGGADVVGDVEVGTLPPDMKYQPSRRTTTTATAITIMLFWFILNLQLEFPNLRTEFRS